MSRRPPLLLVILLLSFPQIVETLYSPALPLIAHAYRATPEEAAQTLSFWFVAFALGVVAWGRACDLWGRRPALLAGLALYALGAGGAMIAGGFAQLLAARLISAFGAAAGSIVTQTALRDGYQGSALARVFSMLGIALAVSPAAGMYAGQQIAAHGGVQGVFAALVLLAILLFCASLVCWPETRPAAITARPFWPVLRAMLQDRAIWRSAALIAVFNLAIFGYYQLGPFLFERLEDAWIGFGESGLALALASLCGAFLNAALLRRGCGSGRLVLLGIVLLALGAGLVAVLIRSPAFLIGMALIAAAYAIAIPNILAHALRAYASAAGTAGAILSLFYYNLLGGALVLAGLGQRLDLLLCCCAVGATIAYAWKGHRR
ncbi:MFS transporter [Achromobacter anxifer]|uniref:Inner membrane transport protein YdhC n=1 Tax=Achromobacter anxifer TaxID=1287737 RepID=A0A6S7DCE0_9BURK|nr:MFS transporter [Achromobacter anxifer]MDF8362959.1 MFS transporter [Achromobacter anxifer]CAB3876580.1 Inner membrane transport protein YdhC [Achromobacter anxifer]CAB5515409.1 Inner membrane transport protein YdhC [Achromobacter anxifer]